MFQGKGKAERRRGGGRYVVQAQEGGRVEAEAADGSYPPFCTTKPYVGLLSGATIASGVTRQRIRSHHTPDFNMQRTV